MTEQTTQNKIYLFDTKQVLPPQESPQIPGPYNDMKILFQAADDAGCGGYRCIFPAEAMRKKGALVKWCYKATANDLYTYDTYIFQRPMLEITAIDIKMLKASGKLTLVELDDNLHNVPSTNPVYDIYKPHKLKWLTECIKEAHGLIVSTPELAQYYYSYNKNIIVCPNSVDFELNYRDWTGRMTDIVRKSPDDFVLGFRGGICLSKETEILTKSGFKLFKDLLPEDLVAQKDINTNVITYVKPLEYIHQKYTGYMYKSKYFSHNFDVTADHKMLCSLVEDSETMLIPMKDLEDKSFYLDYNVSYSGKKSGLSPNALYLYGMSVNAGKYDVPTGRLYFYPFRQQQKIANLLKELKKSKIPYTINSDNVISFAVKDTPFQHLLKNFIFRYAVADYHPDVFDYCTKDIQYIIQGVLAITVDLTNELDTNHSLFSHFGNPHKGSKYDSFQRLLAHSGYRSNKSPKVYVNRPNVFIGQKTKINPSHIERYYVENEDVYCVTVPNHIICTRLNHFVMWTGNSHIEDIKILDKTIPKLMEKYPNFNFSIYSALEFSNLAIKLLNLQKYVNRVQIVQPRSFSLYPIGLAGPDCYVVPLCPKDKLFNDCKSELALAEVGSLGIPGVASDCAPYNRFGDNDKYSLKATPREFVDKISYLIENRDICKDLGERARYRVQNFYNVTDNVNYWIDGIRAIKEATSG